MSYRNLPLIAVIAAALTALPALAQTQPAAGVQALEATITGVEGNVQVRSREDQPWVRAEVGMKLNELAEFRTGPKSAVRFTIPPDQTVTLDRLGTLKLLQAVNDNGRLKTSLGMRYGRTRFDIEAAGREHDASISSPSSTLAVRGTQVNLFDQRPFRAEAVSLTGRADFRDAKKQVAFGARNQGLTVVNVEDPDAASAALEGTVIDPSLALARSGSEGPLIDRLLASGSTVFFDQAAGIKVVTGGVPPTDQELIPVLPGVMSFVARWGTDADLNFSVATPGGPGGAGEILYPIGALSTNSSGGKVAFDHRGGPNGGIEIIYFPNTPPDGLYGLGLTLISGPTTTAQVDAFLNGERVDIFNGQTTVRTAIVDVAPPIPGFVDGTAVGVVGINTPIPGAGSSVQAVTPSAKPAALKPAAKPKATVASRRRAR
jgi:hypothetical protein